MSGSMTFPQVKVIRPLKLYENLSSVGLTKEVNTSEVRMIFTFQLSRQVINCGFRSQKNFERSEASLRRRLANGEDVAADLAVLTQQYYADMLRRGVASTEIWSVDEGIPVVLLLGKFVLAERLSGLKMSLWKFSGLKMLSTAVSCFPKLAAIPSVRQCVCSPLEVVEVPQCSRKRRRVNGQSIFA